jgi:hypothetical protein
VPEIASCSFDAKSKPTLPSTLTEAPIASIPTWTMTTLERADMRASVVVMQSLIDDISSTGGRQHDRETRPSTGTRRSHVRFLGRRNATGLLCLLAACSFPRPADVEPDVACTANEPLGCEGNVATTCNATGDDTLKQECGAAGCNTAAGRCNECAPDSSSCVGANEIDHCGPDGLLVGREECSAGCISAPTPHCAYLEPRYRPGRLRCARGESRLHGHKYCEFRYRA